MSCDSKLVHEIGCNCERGMKIIAVGYLMPGDITILEGARRQGKQTYIDKLKEIFSRPENNPKQKVFGDTCEQAKRAIEQYQDFEPLEYNQTKYIKQKANAKPFFSGKN